jgi:hypothetical protein
MCVSIHTLAHVKQKVSDAAYIYDKCMSDMPFWRLCGSIAQYVYRTEITSFYWSKCIHVTSPAVNINKAQCAVSRTQYILYIFSEYLAYYIVRTYYV